MFKSVRFLVIGLALLLSACSAGGENAQFRVDGENLHISGVLSTRTPAEFERLYAANPNIRRLVLGVIEGSSDDEANAALFYRVRQLGLETYLTANSEVYSGGSDLFISGATRRMEKGAVIGVHSWSDGERDAADYPRGADVHKPYVAFTTRMLGSPDWYWFTIYAAPADGMHNMTAAEIRKYGLLTGPVIQK